MMRGVPLRLPLAFYLCLPIVNHFRKAWRGSMVSKNSIREKRLRIFGRDVFGISMLWEGRHVNSQNDAVAIVFDDLGKKS